ncbi:hypothetical protein PQX77_001725 [Marasmius sp. AFHP31]|nr:hypothetical protein PQX77_001725 [Marasmius sp. AFHP31]
MAGTICTGVVFSERPDVSLDILRHNTPFPTDTENAETFRDFKDKQNAMEALEGRLSDDKIDKKVKEAIEGGRLDILEQMEHRRSWIAPVRSLPTEVLEEIFYCACCGDDPLGYALCVRRVENARVRIGPTLKLGLVCYWWRMIVHSSPRLWASILVNVMSVTSQVREMVDFYLMRSGHYPLRLAIVDSDRGGYKTYSEVGITMGDIGTLSDAKYVLEALLQNMDRAKEVLLGIHPAFLVAVSLPTLTFPNLRSFVDESDDGDELANYSTRLWYLIGCAPNLKSVHFHFVSRTHITVMPFESLTSITLDYVKAHMLLEVLSRCTTLRKLHINHLVRGIDPSFSADHRITVSCMNQLHIQMGSINTLDVVFPVLSLPSLTTLSIVALNDSEDDTLQLVASGESFTPGPTHLPAWAGALATMLEHSSCKLRHLAFEVSYPSNISVSTLPDLLPSFPYLQTFYFSISGEALHNQERPRFMNALLARIIPDVVNPNNILVPRLSTLIAREPLPSMDKISSEGIVHAIKSRSKESLEIAGVHHLMSPLELVLLEFEDHGGEMEQDARVRPTEYPKVHWRAWVTGKEFMGSRGGMASLGEDVE